MSKETKQADCDETQIKRIVARLRVRPETLDDLCGSLGLKRPELKKHVDALRRQHVVQEIEFEGESYYTLGW
jgi:predicted ArsR family transcriptional regulator